MRIRLERDRFGNDRGLYRLDEETYLRPSIYSSYDLITGANDNTILLNGIVVRFSKVDKNLLTRAFYRHALFETHPLYLISTVGMGQRMPQKVLMAFHRLMGYIAYSLSGENVNPRVHSLVQEHGVRDALKLFSSFFPEEGVAKIQS